MYEQFNVDKNVEKSGIWYQPSPGFQVLLARAGGSNRKYSALVEKLLKPHRRAIRNDKADSKIIAKLLKEAFSKTVILGWQVLNDKDEFVDGIANPDDINEILPVTSENILMVIDRFDDLYMDIKEIAESASVFLKEDLEADSKN